MERYDLSKASHMREFANNCNSIIRKASQQTTPDIVIDQLIRMDELLSIWNIFNTDYFLWECKYSIMLTKKTRNTFEHYRDLSSKNLKKELR